MNAQVKPIVDAHTPAPWRAHEDTETFRCTISGVDGIPVCRMGGDITQERTAANAAHIVRCVNSHDELVRSGAAFLQWFREFMGPKAMAEINSAALNDFDAAINEAQS